MADTKVRVGAARADISPKTPVWLGGMGPEFKSWDGEVFKYSARNEPTADVHDPLSIEAFYFACGDVRGVLLTADLLHPVALEPVTEAVAQNCELSVDQVFYATSHNHSGPVENRAYTPLLVSQAVACATQAMDKAEEIQVQTARAWYDRLIYDRAEPWGPVSGDIDVVQFVSKATGKPTAQLWNYGCHPCSLDYDYLHISADYPGALRKRVAESLGEDVTAGFVTGCSGNVQIIGIKRFDVPTRMYLHVPKGDYEAVDALGTQIAKAGLDALAKRPTPQQQPTGLVFERFTVEVPVKFEATEAELRQRLENADALVPAVADEDFKAGFKKKAQNWLNESLDMLAASKTARAVPAGVIMFDDVAILLTPFEVAWQIGQAVRDQSPFKTTLISTTSLGYESYITDPKFYERDKSMRPYEAHGFAALGGYSYTPESPPALAAGFVEKLKSIR